MSKTNKGLVAYAKAQVGKPYWFGCFGQKSTNGLLASKRRQYPSYYTASDFNKQIGVKVHDCIGLIKGYLWCEDSNDGSPKYNSSQDTNAKGMYAIAKVKGTNANMKYLDGVLVFKGVSANKIHHVGVYCEDGYVYEAKGHAYGVVKTKYKNSDWQYWCLCPFIEYGDKPKVSKNYEEIAKMVIAGKFGNGTERKDKVTKMGYNYAKVQKIVNEMLKK